MRDTFEGDDAAPGLDRRTFLKRSAGTLAAFAVARAFGLDAAAQEAARGANQFFTSLEAEMLEAIADRIWPGGDGDPGGAEAGAVVYIDRSLAGEYAAYGQTYRVILADLNERAEGRYGRPIPELDATQLDDLLRELEERAPEDDPLENFRGRNLDLAFGPSSSFGLLRKHVMEGVFADPVHGGNIDFAGWRTVGYPGAHYVYSAAEQQVFEPLDKPYQSVADL